MISIGNSVADKTFNIYEIVSFIVVSFISVRIIITTESLSAALSHRICQHSPFIPFAMNRHSTRQLFTNEFIR